MFGVPYEIPRNTQTSLLHISYCTEAWLRVPWDPAQNMEDLNTTEFCCTYLYCCSVFQWVSALIHVLYSDLLVHHTNWNTTKAIVADTGASAAVVVSTIHRFQNLEVQSVTAVVFSHLLHITFIIRKHWQPTLGLDRRCYWLFTKGWT